MADAGTADRPGLPVLSRARVRHVLAGSSVVDWPRLLPNALDDVDAFLRVNEFDVEDPRDQARLRTLRDRAADYLRVEHRYRLPPEVITGDPRDLFLFAAGVRGRRHARSFACMLLKAMHVVHHLEARELGQHLPLSAAEVGHLMEAKVTSCVQQLREQNAVHVLDFSGGQKARSSLITKLLAKQDTIAAQVHDRLRFRVVVETREELPLLVDLLTQRLFPFNYVVPGQSRNDLVDPAALQDEEAEALVDAGHPPVNEFSGSTYKVINLVADIPMRVPPEVMALRANDRDLGRIIFVLVELQLVDAATARRNEQGENNHEEYKNRQKQRVRARLEQGEFHRLREGSGSEPPPKEPGDKKA